MYYLVEGPKVKTTIFESLGAARKLFKGIKAQSLVAFSNCGDMDTDYSVEFELVYLEPYEGEPASWNVVEPGVGSGGYESITDAFRHLRKLDS